MADDSETHASSDPVGAAEPRGASVQRFDYRGQTVDGGTIDGTIEANDHDDAREQLERMQVVVTALTARPPAPPKPPPTGAAKEGGTLSAADFRALNEQLAELAKAGLPLERGLRLIARDMPTRGVRRTLDAVASDLEQGVSLREAFDRQGGRFPALYGRVLEAGVATGDLQGVLLRLSGQLELRDRLRRTIVQAFSYPVIVLVLMMGVMGFISWVVVPPMRSLFAEFDTQLPRMTRMFFATADGVPWIFVGMLAVVAAVFAIWRVLRWIGRDAPFVEAVIHPIPLLGGVLKRGLVAQWCGGVRLGVEAGLDLPRAIRLASEATGSPALIRDADRMERTLARGGMLTDTPGLRRTPMTALSAMDLAGIQGDLPRAMGALERMFERQAEHRMSILRTMLVPLTLVVLAMTIGTAILALFLPLPTLIQSVF